MFLHFFQPNTIIKYNIFLKNNFKNLYFTNTFNNICMEVTSIVSKLFEVKHFYLKKLMKIVLWKVINLIHYLNSLNE